MADIYAWMATGPNGDYPLGAVVAAQAVPLMTSKEPIARSTRWRRIANVHAAMTGEPVRLLRYVVAEELDVV